MTQRIHDRLNGEFNLDNEILVRAIRTGKYIDKFTTDHATPGETKAALEKIRGTEVSDDKDRDPYGALGICKDTALDALKEGE